MLSYKQSRKTPTPFDLRVFAALLCPFAAVVGWWIGKKIDVPSLAWWAVGLTAPLCTLGLWRTTFIRPVYERWMRVMRPVGHAVSLLLLTAIYFLVVTPIGLLLRLFGIDPANRKPTSNRPSEWTPCQPRSPESAFRPF
jgi:hypothetical protein